MELLIQSLYQRSCLWWVGQLGIVLEILGAAFIVMAAYKNRKKVEQVANTWEGLGHLSDIKEAIQGQAITELRGFLLLGIGLVLQFLGGFSNS